jgi:hypothetical protein
METNPTDPFVDGNGIPIDATLPPSSSDPSWSEFFGGVWRRVTNPLPPS